MEAIIQPLIQINLYFIAFYLVYAVFLRKETHFKLNRFYLLISLIAAIGLPFIQLPTSTIESVQNTEVSKTTQALLDFPSFFVRDAPQPEYSLFAWLTRIYILGVCLMLGRFLLGLSSIIRLIKQGKLEKCNGYYWVKTSMATKPFSFLNYLFWDNPNAVSSTEASQIEAHELTHIRQWHSLDILFLEIIHIVFWYNPICWFYKNAIRNIHEYLADDSIINKDSDKVNYSELLLGQFFQSDHVFLTSQFLHKSILKSRIMMLHKVKSRKSTMLRVLWSVPIIALFIFIQACSEKLMDPLSVNDPTYTKVKTVDFKLDIEAKNLTAYTMILKGGYDYRFNLDADASKTTVQLLHADGALFMSNQESKSRNSISFKCPKTGSYQLKVVKGKLAGTCDIEVLQKLAKDQYGTDDIPEGWDILNNIELQDKEYQELIINELSANVNVLIHLSALNKQTAGIKIDVYDETDKKVASNLWNEKYYSELYYKNREGSSITLKITRTEDAAPARLIIGKKAGKKKEE